jgi:hypothetical protein
MIKFDNKGKQRTEAYVGTFSTECAGDMMEVESIRTLVKNFNKDLKASGATCKYGKPLRYRVDLKARQPINKVLNKRTGRLNGYTWGGDVIGGIANARAVDLYIHRNWNYYYEN